MKYVLKLIIISFIMTYTCYSQDISFGLKGGSIITSVKEFDKSEFTFYPLSNIFFFIEIPVYEKMTMVIQPGLSFISDNYRGLDLDLSINGYLVDKKFYLTSGMGFHQNFGNDHGTGIFTHVNSELLKSINLGVGYLFTQKFFTEIRYHFTIDNITGYNVIEGEPYNGTPPGKYVTELNNFIKISLGFRF